MAIAQDVSTPIRWTASISNGSGTASAAFTAPTDALLAVDVEVDTDGTSSAQVMTVSDSGGLAWTTRVERNDNETTAGGYSGWFYARTVSAVSRTVTVTRTSGNSGSPRRVSAFCRVLTGVDVNGTPVDTVSASNEGGDLNNSMTTTSVTPGGTGILLAASCEWAERGVFNASSDLTNENSADYAGNISVDSGFKACTSGVGVTANLNAGGALAAQHKWTQIIVREAAGGGGTTANAVRRRTRPFASKPGASRGRGQFS